jgi:hypothetical protein
LTGQLIEIAPGGPERDWESMTGMNFYDILPYGQAPTSTKRITFKTGGPSSSTVDSDGNGFLDYAFVYANTTNNNTINHEAGWRALTGNAGCAVTSYTPSNWYWRSKNK